jgi:hypothetical protein
MKAFLAAAGVLAFTVTVSGCGGSPRPHLDPDVAGSPTWGDCLTFSESAMSIAEGARGTATVAAAISDYRESGDRVLVGPRAGGNEHRWLVREDDTIHADLEVWHSRRGWFVTGAQQCAH